MGFTSDAQGKPHWRGTKCVSRSCQGQALEPGSLRLTWSASRKHRCQVEPPRAGSLCSGSSQVILNVPRKPEPRPQHQACTPAAQPKLGMRDASAAGLKWCCCRKLLCLFLRPHVVVLEQAKLRMLHLAGRYGGREG